MLFIAVEGPDGSGKTTFAKALSERIGGLYTKEPTDGGFGRAALEKTKVGAWGPALSLFVLDRSEHIQLVIAPSLVSYPVVCDRYLLSTLVYQYAPGGSFQEWRDGYKRMLQDMPMFLEPHITFLLGVDCKETCKQRRPEDGSIEWAWQRYLHLTHMMGVSVLMEETVEGRVERAVRILMQRFPLQFEAYLCSKETDGK